MSGKRERVLDAAIEVLGTRGMRGLTHRAVDEVAGIPQGSTSNYFRTRGSLLEAVMFRLVERDREDWRALAAVPRPTSVDEFAAGLAGFVRSATGPDRVRTAARYALFVAAVAEPELATPLGRARAELLTWATDLLAGLGAAEPDRGCRILADYLDGMILHQLSTPAAQFDPASEIAALTCALLGADPGRP
ncbi:TetR/AcrR family transcriptional regulator [Rhodococcus maanshanensis]|uniref:DNA-binding transcriptional regulator YbjK n=1 Tax=Rhodococcus maanshanensis TaxID=183556 RepID=A0A1H7VZN7_9NOCA|nr:TetR family transcriptional regulator [Rhodococcus maanshanensis]SEM14701.1 DNA-binding transcriptional regulator YbjK [Rhodococcus maanshanensis]